MCLGIFVLYFCFLVCCTGLLYTNHVLLFWFCHFCISVVIIVLRVLVTKVMIRCALSRSDNRVFDVLVALCILVVSDVLECKHPPHQTLR